MRNLISWTGVLAGVILGGSWLSAADFESDAGKTVVLSIESEGTAPFSYQWFKNGVPLAGATKAELTLEKVGLADSGTFTVRVSNMVGASEATASLAVVARQVAPLITQAPVDAVVDEGGSVTLSAQASGEGPFTYQWLLNGGEIAGATQANLVLSSFSGAQAGSYAVRVTNAAGSTVSRSASVTLGAQRSRILNVSIRSVTGLEGLPLIFGYSVSGDAPKKVLMRAVGPGLAPFGVEGVLKDPRLTLYEGGQSTGFSEDWGDEGRGSQMAALFTSLGAFQLGSPGGRDAALVAHVKGPRTVHVAGRDASEKGVVLVEVYDADSANGSRIVNASALNVAGSGEEVLILGFVIDGPTPVRVLVRGVGPSLEGFGVQGALADPEVLLFAQREGVSTQIATNDNWSGSTVEAAAVSVGAFPLRSGSRDAAVVATLAPGAYTACIRSRDGTTGRALVEIYELP